MLTDQDIEFIPATEYVSPITIDITFTAFGKKLFALYDGKMMNGHK
jgi:hypothetical protein